MSLGFGVGDVLAISKLARQIYGRVRDSPDQLRAIKTEVASLKIVVDELAEQVSTGQWSTQQTAQLKTLVEGCRSVLQELEVLVTNSESLATKKLGLSAKTGSLFKKLKWDQAEVDRLSQSSRATSEKIEVLDERVQSLQLDQDKKDSHAILEWLSSSDFPAYQSTLSSRRQQSTGNWLTESGEFQAWIKTVGKSLVCQEKTMLVSLVVDHLRAYLTQALAGVMFLYCDYRADEKDNVSYLLASLLKQSLQQQMAISNNLKKTCQDHMNAGTRAKDDEIFAMLQMAMKWFPRNFIIVDALDEMSNHGATRRTFLSILRGLQSNVTFNLMTTSRHIPELSSDFNEYAGLEIDAHPADIELYVWGHIADLPSCVRANTTLQETIATAIVDAAKGMFLLTQLNIDSLKHKVSPRAIRETLAKLPKGSTALNHAYEAAIQRIEKQPEGLATLAKQVLGWLTYAERLMSITELRHGIAVVNGERKFDTDNLVGADDLIWVCAGLVVVDSVSDVVRLVHYTTQTYLEENMRIILPEARSSITAACLTYLMYDEHETGWIGVDGRHRIQDAENLFLRTHPFYEYAAQSWIGHLGNDGQCSIPNLLLDFAKNDVKISTAANILLPHWRKVHAIEGCFYHGSWPPNPITALHLFVFLGAAELVRLLLSQGFEPHFKDWKGETPLQCAVRIGGYSGERMVETLPSCASVDVNHKDREGYTPLIRAAAEGHAGIVHLLLANPCVDVNAQKKRGTTALIAAVGNGHKSSVKLLLACEKGDVNAKNETGEGVLHVISCNRLDLPDQLLRLVLADPRIDVNIISEGGETAFYRAVYHGFKGMSRQLLAHPNMNWDIESNVKGKRLLDKALRPRNIQSLRADLMRE